MVHKKTFDLFPIPAISLSLTLTHTQAHTHTQTHTHTHITLSLFLTLCSVSQFFFSVLFLFSVFFSHSLSLTHTHSVLSLSLFLFIFLTFCSVSHTLPHLLSLYLSLAIVSLWRKYIWQPLVRQKKIQSNKLIFGHSIEWTGKKSPNKSCRDWYRAEKETSEMFQTSSNVSSLIQNANLYCQYLLRH